MKGTLFLKRVSKTLSLLLLIATLSLSATKPVEAGTWRQDAKGWWYQNDNNSYPRSSWQLIGGQWYYFNATGYMATGWLNLGGSWYYLQPSGAMATGWLNLNGTWYYLNPSGAMATGWLNLNGAWYHLQPSGTMSANRWEGNYYLEGSGAMATNKWIGQYYVGADGAWIPDYQVPVATPIPTPTTPKPTETPSYHPDPLVTHPPADPSGFNDGLQGDEWMVYEATLSHEIFLELNKLRVRYGKEPFGQSHGIALQMAMIQAGSNVLQFNGTDNSAGRHGHAISVASIGGIESKPFHAERFVKTWEDSWGHLRNIVDEPNGSVGAVAAYQRKLQDGSYVTTVIFSPSPNHERDLLFKDNVTVIKQGTHDILDESYWESLLNPVIVR
jgi:FOG: Glucan-binding domain (YG repeat)